MFSTLKWFIYLEIFKSIITKLQYFKIKISVNVELKIDTSDNILKLEIDWKWNTWRKIWIQIEKMENEIIL